MSSILHLQCCVVYETNEFSKHVVIGNLGIVGCDGVSGGWFSSFQRIIVPSSSIVKVFLDCFILSDEGTMILQKFRNLSPSDTESHPRRPDPQQHCCKNQKSSPLLLIQCFMWYLQEDEEHGGGARMVIIWVLIICWWLSFSGEAATVLFSVQLLLIPTNRGSGCLWNTGYQISKYILSKPSLKIGQWFSDECLYFNACASQWGWNW
jgi:hypothetical protein